MAEQHGEFRGSTEANATLSPAVVRGEKSWTILNTVAGFALAIEGTLISMADALPWWVRCLSFLALGGGTLALIRSNWRVQDRIIRWVSRYQGRAR